MVYHSDVYMFVVILKPVRVHFEDLSLVPFFYSSPVPGTVPPARNREELKKEATFKSTNVWFQRNLSLCFSFISKC